MEESIVKVKHLSHRYSVQWAIKDINFEIKNKVNYNVVLNNKDKQPTKKKSEPTKKQANTKKASQKTKIQRTKRTTKFIKRLFLPLDAILIGKIILKEMSK